MPIQIIYNGKRYDGLEKMPADVRAEFLAATRHLADRNNDGVPDLFQEGDTQMTMSSRRRIVINGREYASWKDVPDELRQRLERKVESFDARQRLPGVGRWVLVMAVIGALLAGIAIGVGIGISMQ